MIAIPGSESGFNTEKKKDMMYMYVHTYEKRE